MAQDETGARSAEPSEGTPATEAAGRRGRRPIGIRIFSSASDAPRSRRPTDAVMLVLAVLGAALLSIAAPGPTVIDTAATNFVAHLPGLVGWFWEAAYLLLIIWSLVLMLLALLAHGRKRLFLYEVLAVLLALGFAILAGRNGGTDPSTSLRGLINSASPPIYLATRLAIATAVIVTASPDLARPIRLIGRWLIGIGAVAAVALGAALPIGVAAGFLIGFGSAALVHLLVGSPGGRLTLDQVTDVLQQLGVDAIATRDAPLQRRGVALTLASTPEGKPLLVKVFGRDAWDGQFVAATWYAIWHKGAKRVGAGRLEQVEHEAFLTLAAERGGVPVMSAIAAGEVDQGDAVLVLEASGRPLASVGQAEVDVDLLHDSWQALKGLHDLGISHGRVNGETLVVRSDGSPALTDLGDARVAAPDMALCTDRAQLLVTTALVADTDTAVTAATDVLGKDGLATVLSFLQPAAFGFETRKAMHDQHLDLKGLRELIATRTDTEIPPLEPLERVTWKSLVKLAVIGFLAYTLISAFANIGIDTIVSEFKDAIWGWLLVGLILSPLSQIPQAFSTLGATLHEIRFWPVLMLQYAVQFIGLAVPSSAARVAMEVRFFERSGVPSAGAVSIGAVDSVSTFVIQILMIVLILAADVVTLNLATTGQWLPRRRWFQLGGLADRDPPDRGRARHRLGGAEDAREVAGVPKDPPREVGRCEGSARGAPPPEEGAPSPGRQPHRPGDARDHPGVVSPGIRAVRVVGGIDLGQHVREPLRRLHARARWGRRRGGRLDGGTDRDRRPRRCGGVNRDRVPSRDLLSPAVVGCVRRAVAEAAVEPVRNRRCSRPMAYRLLRRADGHVDG